MISAPRDRIAIILYNCSVAFNDCSFPGVHVYHALAPPSIRRIEEIELLSRTIRLPDPDGVRPSAFDRFFGSIDTSTITRAVLPDALWCASHMFVDGARVSKRFLARRLWIYTDAVKPFENLPPVAQADALRSVTEQLDALHDHGVRICLHPFPRSMHAQVTGQTRRDAIPTAMRSVVGSQLRSLTGHLFVDPSASPTVGTQGPDPPTASLHTTSARVATTTTSAHAVAAFDAAPFWSHVLDVGRGDGEDEVLPPNWVDDDASIAQRTAPRRAAARLSLFVGAQGLEIACELYLPLVRAKKPPVRWVHPSTGERVGTVTTRLDAATGEQMVGGAAGPAGGASSIAGSTASAMTIGGVQIGFTADQVRAMRSVGSLVGSPGIRIIGFRYADEFPKAHHCLQPAMHLVGCERDMEGSARAFAALVLRMIAKRLTAVAVMLPRASGTPSIVALVPRDEPVASAEGLERVACSGLSVVPLPYADDVRVFMWNDDTATKPEPRTAECAVQMIRVLRPTHDFSVANLPPNPSMDAFMAGLEALALRQPTARAIEDETQPDHTGMDACGGAEMSAFAAVTFPADYVPDPAKPPKDEKPRAVKRPREDAAAGETTIAEALAALDAGTLDRYTRVDLVAILRQAGGLVSGTKPVLLGRIRDMEGALRALAGPHHAAATVASSTTGSSVVTPTAIHEGPVPAAPDASPIPVDAAMTVDPVQPKAPPCPYGQRCYRKNPAHFVEFSHPDR